MQTLLITGGAGFIGSSLIEKLIHNYNLICLDDFNDYYDPKRKQNNIEPFLKHNYFTLYPIDIRNYQELESVFKKHKIDKTIHLAARAGVRPSIQNPLLYEEVNVRGTLNLLELAKIYKIPHFIFASSSSVYGNQTKVPFSETDPVDSPISPYAATKKAGELLCHTYAHLYKIKTTCLRFFTVYGPKGRLDMAPYLFTQAILNNLPIIKYGNGDTKRDYTYVEDIVEGIIKAIEKPFAFEIINLGNKHPISLNQFISILEELTGKKARFIPKPLQPGDVHITYADINKAKKLLNWQPKTKLIDGLEMFIQWYKSNKL
jgi:UDP-glucuronate 4-epimerase